MTAPRPSTCCPPSSAPPAGTLADRVRERYAAIARAALAQPGTPGRCCDDRDQRDECGRAYYDRDELAALPQGSAATMLGSGHPVAAADLRPGETVVDLGSGGGADVLLAARAVGTTGRVIGVDATTEMVTLARRNADEAKAANVTFHHARIEQLPLADASVDVVLSNCVVNLSVDKPAVLAEIARVLRPGGRVVISDLVAEDHLSSADRAERGSHAGCIAGAWSFAEYRAGLREVGLVDVDLSARNSEVDGIHRTLVRARAPQHR